MKDEPDLIFIEERQWLKDAPDPDPFPPPNPRPQEPPATKSHTAPIQDASMWEPNSMQQGPGLLYLAPEGNLVHQASLCPCRSLNPSVGAMYYTTAAGPPAQPGVAVPLHMMYSPPSAVTPSMLGGVLHSPSIPLDVIVPVNSVKPQVAGNPAVPDVTMLQAVPQPLGHRPSTIH